MAQEERVNRDGCDISPSMPLFAASEVVTAAPLPV